MNDLKRYLQDNIDDSVQIESWNRQAKQRLRLQLYGLYVFYRMSFLDNVFIVVVPKDIITTRVMINQLKQIYEASGMDVALFLRETTVYQKKEMLRERIPFIISDREMYLPFMATQLRSKNDRIMRNTVDSFTPATQMIFLYLLYQSDKDVTMNQTADDLGISVMTAQRGYRDLLQLNLVTCTVSGKTGRKKVFRRIEQSEYYHQGKDRLRDPVQENVFVSKVPQSAKIIKSDITALSEQTMLGESKQSIYAMNVKDRSILNGFEISREQGIDEKKPCIQLVKYNILALSRGGYEDPISLILGLSEKDERVEMAVDELMEKMKWYTE